MILALNSHRAAVTWKSHEFGKNQDGTFLQSVENWRQEFPKLIDA